MQEQNKFESRTGMARVPGRSASDAAGVCRIFGAGPRLRHLCADGVLRNVKRPVLSLQQYRTFLICYFFWKRIGSAK